VLQWESYQEIEALTYVVNVDYKKEAKGEAKGRGRFGDSAAA